MVVGMGGLGEQSCAVNRMERKGVSKNLIQNIVAMKESHVKFKGVDLEPY